MKPFWARTRRRVLLLALLLLVSACTRREDVAEPLLDFLNFPASPTAPAAPVIPDPAPEPDPPPPDPAPLATPDPPVADSPEAVPDRRAALTWAAPLLTQAVSPDGRTFALVRVGVRLVGRHPDAPSAALWRGAEQSPVLAVPADSDLSVWSGASDASFRLCETSPSLGDALFVVAPGGGLVLAVTVAREARELPAAGVISGTERFVVLDRPALPELAGGVLLDGTGALCGLLTGRAVHGLMAALSPAELRLWQSAPDLWASRYPPEKNPIPAPESAAPPETDDTPRDPFAGPPMDTNPVWTLPLAHSEHWLGVTVQELSDDLRRSFGFSESIRGLVVTRVHPGSPAQEAGLREDDLLLSLNDTPLERVAQLPDVMASLAVGETATLLLARADARLTVSLPVAPRPPQPPSP